MAASAAEFHEVTTSALARDAVPTVRSRQAAAIDERFIRRSVRRALPYASVESRCKAEPRIFWTGTIGAPAACAWPATRSSLTSAGERRLEAPPGFEPG